MLRHSYATLDEIPEAVRSFYSKGSDGKFYLQVEGMVPSAKLTEFRDNNVKLQKDLDELKAQVGDLDLTVAKDTAAKIKAGEIGELKKSKDVEAQVEARIKANNEEWGKKVNTLNEQNTSLQSKLQKAIIDTGITQTAVELGARKTALQDIVTRANTIFRLDDKGNPIPYKPGTNEVEFGKDQLTPLTMKEWLSGLIESAPHLFEPSNGTGANPSVRMGGAPGENPFITGNVTALSSLYKNNKAQYERFKSEAGAKRHPSTTGMP